MLDVKRHKPETAGAQQGDLFLSHVAYDGVYSPGPEKGSFGVLLLCRPQHVALILKITKRLQGPQPSCHTPEEKKQEEKGVEGEAPLGKFRPFKKGIPGSPRKDFYLLLTGHLYLQREIGKCSLFIKSMTP